MSSPFLDIDALLDDPAIRILVCCGSGGVGKTTTSAALALRAADRGRRVAVRRPRIRTADDERELPVDTYAYFADRDPLTRAVMDRMLAGVSTRRFARVGEPVGSEVEASSSSTGKTAVSDMFIERTRTALSL